MYRNFPLLGDFSSPLEVRRWQGDVEIVDLMSSGGKQKVLKVSLGTTHYSGFSLSYFPRDWSGYRRLQLKLFNPLQSPLKLTIRIHDIQHYGLGQGDYYDRFNRRLDLSPGWNSIDVSLADVAHAPRNRAIDLSEVAALGLFSTRLPEARLIYIDEIRLSK